MRKFSELINQKAAMGKNLIGLAYSVYRYAHAAGKEGRPVIFLSEFSRKMKKIHKEGEKMWKS